ncbi:citrate synthase [Demequina sp. TTPB684]|uniref:citrate synthase n=1 Tax=unclassified Demequina TaxID=2620311 RepID=UPI001CF1E236|nr:MULTISPECIES: citrate synthase [unclassified Demequina]MCB2411758.1 citrate synthase [Demequina sp. TTPB684]UPU87296.1 citrate synthase [Demequina sp. TMPB413]
MTQVNDARLTVDGSTFELDIERASIGNDGISVSNLLRDTGMVTVDPGFTNTASCESAITYIDGENGVLRYRGYPIEQLAEHSTFLEVAYLLIHGQLPTEAELTAFNNRVARHMHVHEGIKTFLGAFPRNAHPMAVLSGAVSALSTFYPESVGRGEYEIELATVQLLAKTAVVISYLQRRVTGGELIEPRPGGLYVDEFMRVAFSGPDGELDIDPTVRRALDLLLILHADHEQNCSTSTVRIVGSSQANIYASVSAGIGALSGPLHGGANEAALKMFDQIKESGDSIEQFVTKVKDKAEGARLMGFGHRVYKSHDPRGTVVKRIADQVLDQLGGNNETFDMAKRLEEIALSDDYFIERKLYPNVDFYTGLVYSAMKFPVPMFTPLFALGRMPGWIAHYREMMNDPQTKIGRPRQIYTGVVERDYVPMAQR